MGCPHTSVIQGKKVTIKLIDGTIINDVFIERKSQYIYLKETGKLDKFKIKYMKIRR